MTYETSTGDEAYDAYEVGVVLPQGFKTGTVMTLMTVMTNGDSYENLPLGFLMMDFLGKKLNPTRFNGWPLIKVGLHLARWC